MQRIQEEAAAKAAALEKEAAAECVILQKQIAALQLSLGVKPVEVRMIPTSKRQKLLGRNFLRGCTVKTQIEGGLKDFGGSLRWRWGMKFDLQCL